MCFQQGSVRSYRIPSLLSAEQIVIWNPIVRQIDGKMLFWVSYLLILVVELISGTGESTRKHIRLEFS